MHDNTVAPVAPVVPVVHHLQEGLPEGDFDRFASPLSLKSWIHKLDLQTVGLVALVVVAAMFLLDLFSKSSSPFGRSLLSSAAHAWEEAGQWGTNHVLRERRSVEPLTKVLDALAKAVKRWEEPQDSVVINRSL